MTLLDPATGAWFPDVAGAMLGRERQTLAATQQMGERSDKDRQQKLQDDALKRENKKIRAMSKVLIDSGDIQGINSAQADTLDIGTLQGMIDGTGLALGREGQREALESHDINQRRGRLGNREARQQQKQMQDFREKFSGAQEALTSPMPELPSAEPLLEQAREGLGRVSDTVAELQHMVTYGEVPPSRSNPIARKLSPEEKSIAQKKLNHAVTNLNENASRLTRLSNPRNPAEAFVFGGVQPTAEQSVDPQFLARTRDALKFRADDRYAVAENVDSLNQAIGFIREREEASRMVDQLPRLKSMMQTGLPPIQQLITPALYDRDEGKTFEQLSEAEARAQGLTTYGAGGEKNNQTGQWRPFSAPPATKAPTPAPLSIRRHNFHNSPDPQENRSSVVDNLGKVDDATPPEKNIIKNEVTTALRNLSMHVINQIENDSLKKRFAKFVSDFSKPARTPPVSMGKEMMYHFMELQNNPDGVSVFLDKYERVKSAVDELEYIKEKAGGLTAKEDEGLGKLKTLLKSPWD